MTTAKDKPGGTRAGPAARWLSAAATTSYGGLLFCATHVPPLSQTQIVRGELPPDKLLHFGAYSLLAAIAVVTAITWDGNRRWQLVLCVFGLVVFAGCDELTQPLFGRATECVDWVADVFGIIIGAVGILGIREMFLMYWRGYGR